MTNDIYLEYDGEKVAVVCSYRSYQVDNGYEIKLHQVCFEKHMPSDGFNLVVCKNNCTIKYINCSVTDATSIISPIDLIIIHSKKRKEIYKVKPKLLDKRTKI